MLGVCGWADSPDANSARVQKGKLIFHEDFSQPLDRKKWTKGSASDKWEVRDGVLTGVCALGTFHGPVVTAPIRGRDLIIEFRVKFENARAVYFDLDGPNAFGEEAHLLQLRLQPTAAQLSQCRGTQTAKKAWHEERRKAHDAGKPDPQPTPEQLADPKFYRAEPLADAKIKIGDGNWHTVTLEVAGNGAALHLDGARIFEATGTVFDAPKTAFSLALGAGKYSFDDVRVWNAVAAKETKRDYTSRVPKFTFASELSAQEAQLKENPLMQRFREARRKLADDPFRPAYHFSSPEAPLNDPNGLCFWQGRWHLFYQARPQEDGRWHWAHTVSDDLIHWRDLPYAIYPNPEEQCYSGATLVEEDRVIAMYHGRELGNMVATSRDPLLLNWEKVGNDTVIPLKKDGRRFHFLSAESLPYRVYDSCIWKKDGVYFSLSGSVEYSGPAGKPGLAEFLFRSKDLAKWEFVHQFVENNPFTQVGDDGACPYFWPVGDRHILIFFSHTSSGQYLLGDYDRRRDKFAPTAHGRFCFGPVQHGGVQAPSATPDGKGGVIAIFNMNSAIPGRRAEGIMTLPRRLTLIGKDELGQEPAGAIESLRGEHQHVRTMVLPANREIVLPNVRGNTLELAAEIDAKNSPMIELKVLRSPGDEEFTRIALFWNRNVTSRFMPPQQKLHVVTLDNTRSSLLPEAQSRPPETAPVLIAGDEPFKLRVFVDRSVVEVFVNGRQCLALRVHPSRADSLGVSLRAQGQDAKLKSLDAWQMKSIYE